MLLRFCKMHGLGNDFVVIDLITQRARLTHEQVLHLANRHLGIGFDQLLLVEPPTHPDMDFRYRIFNADGGEVENCGNGARCFARFVRDRQLTSKRTIKVETAAGPLVLKVEKDNLVTVDMGIPVLAPASVPFQAEGNQQRLSYTLDLGAAVPAELAQLEIGVVSMGNPHAVLRVEDTDTAEVALLGPLIERHPRFPKRVNAGFMQVLSPHHIRLRVFERGAGETQACGTGACAAVVSGIVQGLLEHQVTVDLVGGQLNIEWQGPGQHLYMTGPAVNVFEGRIEL